MNIHSTRVVLALAAVVLAASACGKKSETVTLKTESGNIKVTTGESGVALPADFPTDVPVMKDAVVKMVMGSSEQGNQMVLLNAAKAFPEVVSYYEQALKAQGWAGQAATKTAEGAILILKKDGRDLMVTVAKDGQATNIQIALPRHQ